MAELGVGAIVRAAEEAVAPPRLGFPVGARGGGRGSATGVRPRGRRGRHGSRWALCGGGGAAHRHGRRRGWHGGRVPHRPRRSSLVGRLRGWGRSAGRRLRELRELPLLGYSVPFLSRPAAGPSVGSAAVPAAVISSQPALAELDPVPSLAEGRSPVSSSGAPLSELARGQKKELARECASASSSSLSRV